MRHIEITLPDAESTAVIRAIEKAISASDLRITLKGTLKQFPGSTHWHLKRGQESGTLEVTFWPQDDRAWFSIQDGRKAEWIDGAVATLAAQIERLLHT